MNDKGKPPTIWVVSMWGGKYFYGSGPILACFTKEEAEKRASQLLLKPKWAKCTPHYTAVHLV